jgi:hypothetical protein
MGMNSSQYFDIELIRARLQEFKRQDPNLEAHGASSHEYELNAPLDEAIVEAWELQNKIRLPNEYRDFITHVGNGGAGCDYGLYPFQDGLARPENDEYSWYVSCPREVLYVGGSVLVISTAGCGYDYGIVIGGQFHGTIWTLDGVGISEPGYFWAPMLNDYSDFPKRFSRILDYKNYLQSPQRLFQPLSFHDWYMQWILKWSPLEDIKRFQESRAQVEQRIAQNQSEKIIKTQPNPYVARLLPWLKKKM